MYPDPVYGHGGGRCGSTTFAEPLRSVSNNALEAANATLNSLRSVLATDAAGEALVAVAIRAAKAELKLYRLEAKVREMGYASLAVALSALPNKS